MQRAHLKTYSILLAACGLLAAAPTTVCAQTFDIDWVGASGASYNQASNWNYQGAPSGSVPGGSFQNEVALIGNAAQPTGVALLNSAAPSPGGLTLGNVVGNVGTLNVATGGSIAITAQTPTTGALNVGANGQGFLNISGGSVTAALLNSNATSQIHLSGAGSLGVTGLANLAGTTRVTGGGAALTAGSLTLPANSIYSPVISAGAVAKANITGAATLNGNLNVEFSGGPAPTPGTTWNLIEAGSFLGAGFGSVQVTGLPALPAGQQFQVRTATLPSTRVVAQLQLVELLTLQVNPNTGAFNMVSNSAAGTNINGYQILSGSGLLNTGAAWTRLSPNSGWQAANPSASQLAELKSTSGGRTVSQASPLSLGTPYSLSSLPFGTAPLDDLTFKYNTADGQAYEGLVQFTGGTFFNNFVLTIDPDNGLAELKNDSALSIPIDSYQIRSASGALAAGAWQQFGGTWQAANTSATQLAQLNPTGNRMLGPGEKILLGNIFPNVGSVDPTVDLKLVAANSTPGAQVPVINGVIRVADITTSIPGDFNGNGVVNNADLVVWKAGFGTTYTGSDFLVWQRNYTGGGTSTAAVGSVPEPATLGIALMGLAGTWFARSRSQGRT